MKKKLIYIDELNIIGIFYSIFGKIFNYEINYFYQSNFVHNSKILKNILKFLKINQNGHLQKSTLNHIKSLKKLLDNCNEIIKKKEFEDFIKFYKNKYELNNDGLEKFKNIIKFELYKNNIDKNFSSFFILENLQIHYKKILYYPSNLNTILIMRYIDNNIHINSSLFIINTFFFFIFKFIKKLPNLFKNKINFNKKEISNANNNIYKNYDFGFIPHKGFKYDRFFKKNYFFTNSRNKPNILNIFFNDIDRLSFRYIKRFNLSYINLKQYKISISEFYLVFREYKPFLFFKKTFYKILFLKIIYLINTNNDQIKSLNNFPRKIYIHYDVLCSKYLLFAFHLNNIQTFASQERSRQHIYLPYLFIDNYFIISDYFKKELKKYGYFIKNFIPMGFSRSKYNQNKKVYLGNFFPKQKYKGIVSCFGLYPFPENKVSGYCEAGVSEESNLKFINDIHSLSKNYKDYLFILRFKNTNFFDDKIFSKALKKIKNANNLFFQDNYKKVNSYSIAHNSKIIISKWTSIAEELLSLNKKVIFYDNENYISQYDYFLKNYEFLCKDYDDLLKKFDFLLYNNNKILSEYGHQYEYNEYYNKILRYLLKE